MPRPLTALGEQMRDALPPFLRESPDYLGVIHPLARELERLAGRLEDLRAEFNPATANMLMGAWEQQFRLPVGGRGATLDQRRQRLLTRLRKMVGESSGQEWEDEVTLIVGDGWTYLEHIPGDATTPPAGTLRITLPFAPSGDRYLEALREVREITPAHLAIEFAFAGGGFVLDESRLDLEVFGS